MHIFAYGSYKYDYDLQFSSRKRLSLEVYPDSSIVVKAPHGASPDEIETFLIKKWHWLDKRLTEFKRYHKKRYERQYISGESYYYLGRQYMLLVSNSDRDAVKLLRGKICIFTSKSISNTEWSRRLLNEWFEERRDKIFKHELIHTLRLFDYDYIPRLKVRTMARRWGSCSKDGKTITLNPRLIEAPREAVTYVLIHELCHVAIKPHNAEFYAMLDYRMPLWREVKNKLEVRFG